MTAAPATNATIAAALQLNFGGGSAEQFRKHWPVLRILSKVQGVGTACTIPVEFKRGDTSLSSFHAEGGDYPDEKAVLRDNATLAWTEVAQTFAVTDLATGVAGSNRFATPEGLLGGPSAVRRSEAHGTVVSIYDDLVTGFYTGNVGATPKQLAGMSYAAAASGAFAGLDPSDTGYEQWAGSSDTGTLTAFNDDPIGTLRDFISGIRDQGGSADFAFARSALINPVLNAIQSQPSQARIMLPDGPLPVADLGARAVNIDGTWLVEDTSAPANKVHVISSESVELQYLVPDMDVMTLDEIAAGVSALLGRTVAPSAVEQILRRPYQLPPLWFAPLGRTATKSKVGVSGLYQLGWRTRKDHGILTLS